MTDRRVTAFFFGLRCTVTGVTHIPNIAHSLKLKRLRFGEQICLRLQVRVLCPSQWVPPLPFAPEDGDIHYTPSAISTRQYTMFHASLK